MKKQNLLTPLFLFAVSMMLQACASTTESGAVGVNRKQLLAFPANQVNEMSTEGYEQIKNEAKQKGILDKDAQQKERVQTIVNRLVAQTSVFRKDAPEWQWEVHTIQSDEINAFCMPGGKMIVYSGILNKLQLTDAEAAAVIGHEIAHALREHGRERLTEEMGMQAILATTKIDPKYSEMAKKVSGLLISLPHGRRQETEADQIGLELMARAGYQPEASVSLWKKMGAAGGAKAPELLSTHPSDETRITNIEALLPKVAPLYRPQ